MSGMFESGIVSERDFQVRGDADRADELRLISRVLDGDYAAFDEIVERHWRRVASIAGRFLPNPNDVEDVIQEVFVRAFENLHEFRGQASIQTWLIRIALNLCMNRKRSFWQKRVLLVEEQPDGSDRSYGTDADVVQREWSSEVRRILNRMPEKYRLPIVLHYFEDLKGREIADALGWSESTVWSRIYAGCKEMRKALASWQD